MTVMLFSGWHGFLADFSAQQMNFWE